jgi:hypothetical protein
VRQTFELLVGLAFLDHPSLLHGVGQAVGHPGVGRRAIAAGAAGFLIIAFDALGQVQMRHEAHVRFVDAHAEGDGGGHDDAVIAQKGILIAPAHRLFHAGVIRQRLDAVFHQPGSGFLHLLARQAIDDAGASPCSARMKLSNCVRALSFSTI